LFLVSLKSCVRRSDSLISGIMSALNFDFPRNYSIYSDFFFSLQIYFKFPCHDNVTRFINLAEISNFTYNYHPLKLIYILIFCILFVIYNITFIFIHGFTSNFKYMFTKTTTSYLIRFHRFNSPFIMILVCSSVVGRMTQLYCSQSKIKIFTTTMSQPDATTFCATVGGKLVKVDEEWKFDAIQALIRDCPGKVIFPSIIQRKDMLTLQYKYGQSVFTYIVGQVFKHTRMPIRIH
jgi:hypothetical protein